MYGRSTAFMRDWYRGPVSRKNSSTSASTRSEIGILAAAHRCRMSDGRDAREWLTLRSASLTTSGEQKEIAVRITSDEGSRAPRFGP